jgi:pyridoxamine 5'-phosphate oxidase
MDLRDKRKIYTKYELLEDTIDLNPFEQFKKWFQDANESTIIEPNTMVLATATKEALPSARIVLLKEVTNKGFVFYTNYKSRKGQELEENPNAQLLFFWDILERQVRIEGRVEKLSYEENLVYFSSRPEESRAGAIASPQSEKVPNRAFLEERLASLKDQPLTMPSHWGGFVLIPTYFEFWQGRQYRLHDRIFYRKNEAIWSIGRLAP